MTKIDSKKILKMLSDLDILIALATVEFTNNLSTKEIAEKNMKKHLTKISNILYYYLDN